MLEDSHCYMIEEAAEASTKRLILDWSNLKRLDYCNCVYDHLGGIVATEHDHHLGVMRAVEFTNFRNDELDVYISLGVLLDDSSVLTTHTVTVSKCIVFRAFSMSSVF